MKSRRLLVLLLVVTLTISFFAIPLDHAIGIGANKPKVTATPTSSPTPAATVAAAPTSNPLSSPLAAPVVAPLPTAVPVAEASPIAPLPTATTEPVAEAPPVAPVVAPLPTELPAPSAGGVQVQAVGGDTWQYIQEGGGERTIIRNSAGQIISSTFKAFPPEGPPQFRPGGPFAPQVAVNISPQVYNRKVWVIAYDPVLSNTKTIWQQRGWGDWRPVVNNVIGAMKTASNNKLQFTWVMTSVINAYPRRRDGFTHTEASWFQTLANPSSPKYNPMEIPVDYLWVVQQNNICNFVNNGSVDEVWLMGAPFFDFWESQLVGSTAYYFNSYPITTNTCNRLLPIMGFNYLVPLSNYIHSIGHRIEYTMDRVLGFSTASAATWGTVYESSAWGKYQFSPTVPYFYYDYDPGYTPPLPPTYAGCGVVHYAPNASKETDSYVLNLQDNIPSYCDRFYKFPVLPNPINTLPMPMPTVNCQDWGCIETQASGNSYQGFLIWWMQHLPANKGCTADRRWNDWWYYIADPDRANYATNCRAHYLPAVRR